MYADRESSVSPDLQLGPFYFLGCLQRTRIMKKLSSSLGNALDAFVYRLCPTLQRTSRRADELVRRRWHATRVLLDDTFLRDDDDYP